MVSAFKPNLAFFLAYGSAGVHALEDTLAAIPDDIPVILDAKSGDIGSTQRMYGQAAFEALGVDALTVSPYVGDDAVLPLLDTYPGKGLFVLARTSNPAAGRFQDHPGEPPHLYEQVVSAVQGWQIAHRKHAGLVVGATYEAELEALAGGAPELPFLVPGVGAQGGTLDSGCLRCDGRRPQPGDQRLAQRDLRLQRRDFADAARRAAVIEVGD